MSRIDERAERIWTRLIAAPRLGAARMNFRYAASQSLAATHIEKAGWGRFFEGPHETFGIRNGEKSIAIFLHAVWDEDLRQRYGDHDEPATIREWQTPHRKSLKSIERMERPDA